MVHGDFVRLAVTVEPTQRALGVTINKPNLRMCIPDMNPDLDQ